MSKDAHQNRDSFCGFERPEANFIYTPNQFLEICMAQESRAVVRVVGYLIFRTLSFVDSDGESLDAEPVVSFSDFVKAAGVSRGSIKIAVAQAVASGYIEQVRDGKPSRSASSSSSASFRIRWTHPENTYTKDPRHFSGFFAGDGHRTQIPNSFFTTVLPDESLTVIKVVGAVIRHTNGYQNKIGRRREIAPLSYNYLQDFANIKSRAKIPAAIDRSIAAGYIVRVTEGYASTAANVAATYRIRWAGEEPIVASDAGSLPVDSETTGNQGVSDRPVQNGYHPVQKRYHPQNTLETSSKKVPAPVQNGYQDQFKKGTQERHSYKDNLQRQQQQQQPDVVVAKELLLKEGFDEKTAHELANLQALDEIKKQIAALPNRKPTSNSLGLLRRCIEEGWSIPSAPLRSTSETDAIAIGFYAGYAGLEGESVALPSANDQAAAKAIAGKFDSVKGTLSLEELGRKFGKFYRSRTESRPQVHLSFSAAVRTHGDQFIVSITPKSSAGGTFAVDEDQLRGEWLAYVVNVEEHFQAEHPGRYATFVAKRAQKREQVESSENLFYQRHPGIRQSTLTYHDSEAGRLDDFAKAFAEVRAFEIWRQQKTNRVEV